MMITGRGAASCAAALAVLLGGCAADQVPAARDVAEQFYAAYEAGDGEAACALLAPSTLEELEQSARKACSEAVLSQDVPDVGDATDVQVFGDQAQVRFDGDTAFLARYPAGWRVVAVACEPRPDRPYDCQVKGA